MTTPYNKAEYTLSAAKLSQLPPDAGYEVAFAGRSNAGKSSALNSITNRKNLARISKTPGRTQTINIFRLDDERRLIDLPGYGYAKVARNIMKEWQKTLGDYLETRQCLKGLILIMDIRHPLKELDQQMLIWAEQANLPIHILLTKADKLKRGAAMNILLDVQKKLTQFNNKVTIQLFSAIKHDGVDEVRSVLDHWFEDKNT